MTLEQRLKLMLGTLEFTVAALQTQLEEAQEQIAKLTPKEEAAPPAEG